MGRWFTSLGIPAQLLLCSAVTYVVSFALLLLYWQPGRGIGSTLYLAIVLAAMATGPFAGAAAGVLACLLYWIALITGHGRTVGIVFSVPGLIHLLGFVAVGAIVGHFARLSRRMLGESLHLLDDLLVLARRDVVTAAANASGLEAAITTRLEQRRPFVLLVGSPPDTERPRSTDEAELCRMAAALQQQLAETDELARVGDAQFALLASCSHAGEGRELGPRLERALDELGLRITFGWAAASDGASALELYAAAVARLYARRSARNEWEPTAVTAALVEDLESRRRRRARVAAN